MILASAKEEWGLEGPCHFPQVMWGHRQPWGAPIWQKAERTSLQHRYCRNLEERKLRVLQTAAFQNLWRGYRENSHALHSGALDTKLVSKQILWGKKLSGDHWWMITNWAFCPPLLQMDTLRLDLSGTLTCIASCNLSHTFQGFRKLCPSVTWQ